MPADRSQDAGSRVDDRHDHRGNQDLLPGDAVQVKAHRLLTLSELGDLVAGILAELADPLQCRLNVALSPGPDQEKDDRRVLGDAEQARGYARGGPADARGRADRADDAAAT